MSQPLRTLKLALVLLCGAACMIGTFWIFWTLDSGLSIQEQQMLLYFIPTWGIAVLALLLYFGFENRSTRMVGLFITGVIAPILVVVMVGGFFGQVVLRKILAISI